MALEDRQWQKQQERCPEKGDLDLFMCWFVAFCQRVFSSSVREGCSLARLADQRTELEAANAIRKFGEEFWKLGCLSWRDAHHLPQASVASKTPCVSRSRGCSEEMGKGLTEETGVSVLALQAVRRVQGQSPPWEAANLQRNMAGSEALTALRWASSGELRAMRHAQTQEM